MGAKHFVPKPETLSRDCCSRACAGLSERLARGEPAVFNTELGCPFTANAFTGRLEAAGVKVSIDGRGRR